MMRHVVVALGMAWLLAGCGVFKKPGLEVSDAQLTERTQEGAVVTFTIDATNPNADAMSLRGVRYTLDVDGRRVFEGFRSAEATVRRFGTQQVQLPVVIPGAPVAGERRYELRGTIQYVPPGALARVMFDAGIREPTAGFEDAGVIDFGS